MDPWCLNTDGLYPRSSTSCGKRVELPFFALARPLSLSSNNTLKSSSAIFLVANRGCMESHYSRQTSVPADSTQDRGGLAHETICCSRGPLLNPWIPSSRWSEALHCISDRHRPRRSNSWSHAPVRPCPWQHKTCDSANSRAHVGI